MLRNRINSFQIIIIGFAALILIGALLLMLPVASKSGSVTDFKDTLFTAVSAVCVTGLVVRDTASYWSGFGQTVILVLIQIGGLGVITVALAFELFSGRKISLRQRSTMREAIAAPAVGGIIRSTGFLLKGTAAIELLGSLIMMPAFVKDYGLKGIWMAVFHSISAFCNAGFDVMGSKNAKFVSLTSYSGNPLINLTIIGLIVIGGLGFLTWGDIVKNRHHLRHYRLQSKLILVTSACLILVPAVCFYCLEFADLPAKERIFSSLFQSVTTRTAGFNTRDLTAMTGAGKLLMIILMMIGGSPGSTAGGMKTTTAAVLLTEAVAVFRQKDETVIFRRRIDQGVIRQASTILILYLTLAVTGALIISTLEGFSVGECLFETASAIGTVGLTLGLTTRLGLISRCILMFLMFFGRVGGLTLIYAVTFRRKYVPSKFPQEKITVG